MITKIEPRWNHGFANSPDIIVHLDEDITKAEKIWHPCYKHDVPVEELAQVMLISTNLDPWVSFVYVDKPHGDPQFNGALGGAYKLDNGQIFKSRSGWSSRSGVINSQFREFIKSEIVEVTIHVPGWNMGFYGKSLYVDYLREHEKFPKDCYLVRHNPSYSPAEIVHTISVDPNEVVKPNV